MVGCVDTLSKRTSKSRVAKGWNRQEQKLATENGKTAFVYPSHPNGPKANAGFLIRT
jgi:hypothetical protein